MPGHYVQGERPSVQYYLVDSRRFSGLRAHGTVGVHRSCRGRAARAIQSIDVLRGAVIALMAVDDVREFLHVPAYDFDPLDPQRTTAILYATRWITHFCAPTIPLLATIQ